MTLQRSFDIDTSHHNASFSFVWRPVEITPAVLQMVQSTGSRAIFDFSSMVLDELRSFLQLARPAGQVADIKVSADTFFDPALGQLVQETGVKNVWVECHPLISGVDAATYINKICELSASCQCYPITGDLELLAAMGCENSGVGRIVLKGCEASGFVSGETAMSLYLMAKELLGARRETPKIHIWGTVFTPEAGAAFLSTGAAGIVFESLHWLTDLVAIDDLQRQRISRLRLGFTVLVGVNLQVPFRLFNRGNSHAFKDIKVVEDSLCVAEDRGKSQCAFARQLHERSLHPLESAFAQDELIPLGVEAVFAGSFVDRFGSKTEPALNAFIAAIHGFCCLAENKLKSYQDSPLAREMGIRYPFIQGAMSWITDSPEFAANIADAGGLPTIALGMMDTEALERQLGHLSEVMGARPYALNLVSLAENPFRAMQLVWIKKQRPRFVVIAGGDLAPVKGLRECGIQVIYIAPDEALLQLALEAGVRYVICEGYEAGGHVGQNSTLTLAQMVLDLKQRMPDQFQGFRLILAGGICNRETAFMAAMLGADGIQMGTAYLATREIVGTGALSDLYQRLILDSPPGGTVVSGQITGLRVRSLSTPRVQALLSLEREFAASQQDEAEFRTKIEELSAGSLCVAARGKDRINNLTLDESTCQEQGQFMSGACAGLLLEPRSLQSFHQELVEGPLVLHHTAVCRPQSSTGHSPGSALQVTKAGTQERIAITGMSIINSLGKNPEEIWSASLAMKSGIIPVPPSRWDHSYFYDPRLHVADKTYCKVGAFLDFQITRSDLGISPQDFRTMSNATKNTLWLADRAIRASGILESGIPRERIGVIISQNSGEAAGTLTSTIIRAYAHDIMADIKRAVQLTPDQALAIERELKANRLSPDDTTLLGRLNCAAPGFVCNKYGFMGPSYAVSAACATSLVALYSAIQMIKNGIIDAAIVGGSEESLTHLHFLEFSAVGALYGLSGRERPACESSRPFDAERDGMVLGEGGGMIVIEREGLARARGAKIEAIITGMGASNNNLGMVEPNSATQELAIRASFQGLPYGPDAVDLVECHATSTRQGDVEEVHALKSCFNSSKRTVLTSFKSQIGHTLGASGISNLIRGTMAMKAGILPATLNYDHPDPEMGLDGSGFLIATEPLDWNMGNGVPRRFQVNAFGFGGSNYVVQLEQNLDERDMVFPSEKTGCLFADTDAVDSTISGVSFLRTELDGCRYRMAVVASSEAAALAVIGKASLAESEISSPKAVRYLAQQGIFLSPEDKPLDPLALVFPGQGSQYAGMGQELYNAFPVIRGWMDRAAAAADFDLFHLLFNDREENLQKTRWQQPALFAVEHAMARYFVSLGIHPAAMAGHSLGELTALCMAGVFSVEDGFRIVNMRAICMDKAANMHGDPGCMAATDAPLELLKVMIQGWDNIHISNINSPKQVVLGGSTEELKRFAIKLKEHGYRSTLLRVSMAFHTPIMKVIHEELAAFVATIPFHSPSIPVISNTTMAPFPSDPDSIKRILMAHLEAPVYWIDNVQTLANNYGAKIFAEVGPGEALSNLIADTVADPICIQTCFSGTESQTFRAALARLYVLGHLPVAENAKFVYLSGPSEISAVHHVVSTPAFESQGSAELGISESPQPFDTNVMERLIRIIMDATGFERNEVQPGMDLKRDLSIRSSRLPIIMDGAEREFGITIEMEDFIDVHTVDDIARSLSRIIDRQGGVSQEEDTPNLVSEPLLDDLQPPPLHGSDLKRIVFRHAPLASTTPLPLKLGLGESVLFLSAGSKDSIAANASAILCRDFGADVVSMQFMNGNNTQGEEGCDLLTGQGADQAAKRLTAMTNLVGLVINIPAEGLEDLKSMADVSLLLQGFLRLLQAFLQSPTKKFIVLLHSGEASETLSTVLAEGLHGLFLSAALEYTSVQFRTVKTKGDTDLAVVLKTALDSSYNGVEMVLSADKLMTSEGYSAPALFGSQSQLKLNPGDVVVMSGGATGISIHLARSLVPFMPRLVFLGRTEPLSGSNRAAEISRNLAEMHAAGIEASYHTCDVCDPVAVQKIMDEVVQRYDRIDGIIHGAGTLRDGLLNQMSQEDFSQVADVKLLGAWNLFSAVKGAGLRFFVGLSSVVAIQGNPGQTNYAAGNRMMSALLCILRSKHKNICFKAVMLPPIEGAGMAGDPELQALLKRKGVEYIHPHELAGLICSELFIAPADDVWVMFMRKLPAVKTAPAIITTAPSLGGSLDGGAVSYSPEDFPLIEGVSALDLDREELEAVRTFSCEQDLWIGDHRPFTFINHPLVSATMVLETFMEAAKMLFPHLQLRGVRQVQFMEMIQCPNQVPRLTRVTCRRIDSHPQEIICELTLSAQELSPGGRFSKHFTPHYKGLVLLNGVSGCLGTGFLDFPVWSDQLRTEPMDHQQVQNWYADRSGLVGRYRVMESLEGAGPGVVRGRTVCRATKDFSHLLNSRYHYPVYLFESLLQLAGFYSAAMDPAEQRAMIPLGIGEMRFARECRAGEEIVLEARIRVQDVHGMTWDARGIDTQGNTIMQVQGMRMQWVTG